MRCLNSSMDEARSKGSLMVERRRKMGGAGIGQFSSSSSSLSLSWFVAFSYWKDLSLLYKALWLEVALDDMDRREAVEEEAEEERSIREASLEDASHELAEEARRKGLQRRLVAGDLVME